MPHPRVRLGIAGLVAAALSLVLPAVASASRMSLFVSNGQAQFHYFADPGEANQLTVRLYAAGNPYCANGHGQACYAITDPGAAGHVNVGGNCFSLDPTYPGQAQCYLSKLGLKNDSTVHISIRLGDRNDSVTLQTAAATAVVDAGAGDDAIVAGGARKVTLIGGPGNDALSATASTDVLYGDGGNDNLGEPSCGTLPAAKAHMIGGPGIDTVSFACWLTGAKIDLRSDPRLVSVESVIGTPYNDVIYGANRNGALQGGAGNDVIHVGLGYHVAEGGDGNDTIYGGTGGQALSGDAGTDTIYGGPGNDRITDSGGGGKYFGRGGNDTIIADGTLSGGAGNDSLTCTGSCLISDGPGNDYVKGGNSASPPSDGDFVVAGTGRDTYDLGRGPLAGTNFYCANLFGSCYPERFRPDTISYAGRKHPVRVSLDGKANDGEPGEHDNVISAGEIIGGSGDDVLFGSQTHATTLKGGPGNDRLDAGARNDLLDGGPGADVLRAGAGNDWLVGGPGADRFVCGSGRDQVADRKRNERANGCEIFGPLSRPKLV